MSSNPVDQDGGQDLTPETRRWSSHIRKVGNSAAVRLTQDIMAASGMAVDQPVTMTASQGSVTIRVAEDNYEKTLSAAEAFAGRYPLLLDKLGD